MTGFEGKLMKFKAPQPHNAPGFSRNNCNNNNNKFEKIGTLLIGI